MISFRFTSNRLFMHGPCQPTNHCLILHLFWFSTPHAQRPMKGVLWNRLGLAAVCERNSVAILMPRFFGQFDKKVQPIFYVIPARLWINTKCNAFWLWRRTKIWTNLLQDRVNSIFGPWYVLKFSYYFPNPWALWPKFWPSGNFGEEQSTEFRQDFSAKTKKSSHSTGLPYSK